MNAGMAGVIAAVEAIVLRETGQQVFRSGWDGSFTPAAGELVEELAKAGYGNVQEALLAAADEMPIETLASADKASAWLRQRAHSLDPKGHALVKAIHDRKAGARDLLGIAPDWTDGKSTDEYMDEQRSR